MKAVKIWNESERAKSKDSRMEKIKKNKVDPAPGDYDEMGAWKKSQSIQKEFKVGAEKRITFTEIFKNNKKFLPGSGHYNYKTEVLSKLSANPVAVRTLRH